MSDQPLEPIDVTTPNPFGLTGPSPVDVVLAYDHPCPRCGACHHHDADEFACPGCAYRCTAGRRETAPDAAERLQAAVAAAWDEGYAAGFHDVGYGDTQNPRLAFNDLEAASETQPT